MPASRPPMFDDGGDLPDVDRGRSREDHRDRRVPNYLVRRATVVGGVVALIALVGVGVGVLLGGNGSRSGSQFGDSDWNTIVSIDENIGTVVLTDTDGEETERFRLGIQPLTDISVSGSTIVGLATDGLAVADLSSPDEITAVDLTSTDSLLLPSGSVDTVIAHNARSDRAVFVHGPTRELIDTAELDTVPGSRYDLNLARSDTSGRHVLVTDSGNFQSVLFSFDRETPSFFPGLALAVDDSFVVTAQNVGTNANVSVFDHAGDAGVSTQTPSVRAGMIGDGQVILVGVGGEVLSMSISNGDVTTLDSLDIGTVRSGSVALRGDRLVVVGDAGTAIVDENGLVVADVPSAVPTTTGIDELAPRRSACVMLAREVTGEVVVIDLGEGTIRVEALAGPEVLASVSGCQPVVPTAAGYISLTEDAVIPVTISGDVVAISPDGATLVLEDNNRLVVVARSAAADVTTEPVDIGRAGRTVAFADL